MLIRIDFDNLFPPTDLVARRHRMHLTKLLACYNDIVANAKATPDLKYATGSSDAEVMARYETLYFARVVCGHLHEALIGFEQCLKSGLIQTYRPLENGGEECYEQVNLALANTDLRAFLEENRNKTFHYIFDGWIPDVCDIVFGAPATAANTRYVFPEESIRNGVKVTLGFNDDCEREMNAQASALRLSLVRFIDRFVAAIYKRRADAFSQAE